ncbi:hypothetical protein EMCG_09669 [[Emmonsia] crescens]|uniref:Uncharacterized protein n=1 Tax=[Emmonsia] crescens TaxID=73230 RepID=A0A0G2I1V5_9EURO|nr:hypothetical protein EMCG_09669 [Emmonsia crescens UAMH 3008]
MSRLENILGRASCVHYIIVLCLPSFSTGLPTNRFSDDLFSINQGSSGIARPVTNRLNSRDSQLQTSGWEEDQILSTKSKVILGAGASLGLVLVLLSILAVVGIKKEWRHIISAKFGAVKQKPHPTPPEKYSLYFNKRQSSCEGLFSRGSSTVSRTSFGSDHTLHYSPSYVSRTVDSCYQPIEVQQAQVLKVPYHGIHIPPTAVSIRSIQCNRTPNSDHLVQVSPASAPKGATRTHSASRPKNSVQTPRLQGPKPSSNLHLPLTITLPPPIKLQPLQGPWSDR